LKQDGDKITGTVTGRNNTESPIENGKIADGAVSFEVTREYNNNKITISTAGNWTATASRARPNARAKTAATPSSAIGKPSGKSSRSLFRRQWRRVGEPGWWGDPHRPRCAYHWQKGGSGP
jgi:hypothetical protein